MRTRFVRQFGRTSHDPDDSYNTPPGLVVWVSELAMLAALIAFIVKALGF